MSRILIIQSDHKIMKRDINIAILRW